MSTPHSAQPIIPGSVAPAHTDVLGPMSGAISVSPDHAGLVEAFNQELATGSAVQQSINGLQQDAVYTSPTFARLLRHFKEAPSSVVNGAQFGGGLSPADKEYAAGLLTEGLELTDPEARWQHYEEVATIIGDMALLQAIQEDRELANSQNKQLRTVRAKEAAERMELRGFAKLAPRFVNQVADDSRTDAFTYGLHFLPEELLVNNHGQMTEAQGLKELYGFLTRYLKDTRDHTGAYRYPEVAAQAQSMLDNLTFIGEKEYTEAVHGLAQYWKMYLDADANRQVCVLARVSDSAKYPGVLKSDVYLRDRILQTFTDEELKRYSGRIVGEFDDVSAEPEKTKIVFIDDWSISGTQLRRVHEELSRDRRFLRYVGAGSVEANLLVGSQEQLQKGIPLKDGIVSKRSLKVRAYFQSHHAAPAMNPNKGHVTGLHSSVNFDFEGPINRSMVKILANMGRMRMRQPLIALANVVRPYRNLQPHIRLSADRLTRGG